MGLRIEDSEDQLPGGKALLYVQVRVQRLAKAMGRVL